MRDFAARAMARAAGAARAFSGPAVCARDANVQNPRPALPGGLRAVGQRSWFERSVRTKARSRLRNVGAASSLRPDGIFGSFRGRIEPVEGQANGTGAMTAEADNLERILEAQALLAVAIALLDEAGAPPHIAAHLDLAHHQLSALIESGGIGAAPRSSRDLRH